MPYIHASSSGMYPGMYPSMGYSHHHGHGYHSNRRHSSSGSYYGLPTQHYYPNYAYGGYYGGGGYGGYSSGHSHSRAPVIVTHSGHGGRGETKGIAADVAD
ncbi:hypothetical protein DFH09DRAFT_1278963 [Mycena vulgaris]|nr:hypothetical protein DFH09DRAFT_1278963 [Mycena vulgaris]